MPDDTTDEPPRGKANSTSRLDPQDSLLLAAVASSIASHRVPNDDEARNVADILRALQSKDPEALKELGDVARKHLKVRDDLFAGRERAASVLVGIFREIEAKLLTKKGKRSTELLKDGRSYSEGERVLIDDLARSFVHHAASFHIDVARHLSVDLGTSGAIESDAVQKVADRLERILGNEDKRKLKPENLAINCLMALEPKADGKKNQRKWAERFVSSDTGTVFTYQSDHLRDKYR